MAIPFRLDVNWNTEAYTKPQELNLKIYTNEIAMGGKVAPTENV